MIYKYTSPYHQVPWGCEAEIEKHSAGAQLCVIATATVKNTGVKTDCITLSNRGQYMWRLKEFITRTREPGTNVVGPMLSEMSCRARKTTYKGECL